MESVKGCPAYFFEKTGTYLSLSLEQSFIYLFFLFIIRASPVACGISQGSNRSYSCQPKYHSRGNEGSEQRL